MDQTKRKLKSYIYNTMMRFAYIILAIFLAFTFSNCKKPAQQTEPEQPAPVTPQGPETGTFRFHLHTYLEENEVDAYNIVYTNNNDSRKISISMSQMYITDIQLVKSDGSIYNIPDNKKILKVLETDVYTLSSTVPVGTYKSIRFKVGLDAFTNQLNPTTPSDSAILNRPAMWFGPNAQPDGYVFVNVQGKIDTTWDASGTVAQMKPFTFKLGTANCYMQVIMPDKNFTIVKDQAVYGHVIADYYKLFNGLALNNPANLSVTSAASNSVSPATTIINNIPLMFKYEY